MGTFSKLAGPGQPSFSVGSGLFIFKRSSIFWLGNRGHSVLRLLGEPGEAYYVHH